MVDAPSSKKKQLQPDQHHSFRIKESDKFSVDDTGEFNRVDVHWQNDVIAFDGEVVPAGRPLPLASEEDYSSEGAAEGGEVFYYYDEAKEIPSDLDDDYQYYYDDDEDLDALDR